AAVRTDAAPRGMLQGVGVAAARAGRWLTATLLLGSVLLGVALVNQRIAAAAAPPDASAMLGGIGPLLRVVAVDNHGIAAAAAPSDGSAMLGGIGPFAQSVDGSGAAGSGDVREPGDQVDGFRDAGRGGGAGGTGSSAAAAGRCGQSGASGRGRAGLGPAWRGAAPAGLLALGG